MTPKTAVARVTPIGRISAGVISVLILLGYYAPASAGPAGRSGGVTFGDKLTFQSTDKLSYALSPDKEALTVLFEGFDAQVANGGDAAPVVSRVLSIVIPLTGRKTFRNTFFVSGFVSIGKETNGTVVFSINGQTTVATFPPGMEKSFTQKLNFRAKNASEVRMTILLLAETNSAKSTAGFVGVDAIDTDAHEAVKRAANKKR